jgi:non-ribosomal peptide synthetase component F
VNAVESAPRSVGDLTSERLVAMIEPWRVEHLVSAAIVAHPAARSLASPGPQLTYAEMDECSTTVAGELLLLGVCPGDLVGIVTARSPAMAVGALGILKAGAAYVPLDPSHPRERLEFILSDCGTRVVVESSEGSRSAASRL